MSGFMSDEHIAVMRENAHTLSEYVNMDVSLWSNMISKGIIAYGDKDRIQRTANSQTDEVLKFLELLEKKPDKAFNSFIRALRECRQGHVAQLLLQPSKNATIVREMPDPASSGPAGDTEDWRRLLMNNRIFLQQKIDLVHSDLWDYLLQEEVCSFHEKESLVARNPANHEQVSALLDLINRKTKVEFDKFCLCLQNTGHGHVAERISPVTNIQGSMEKMALKTIEDRAKRLVSAIQEDKEKATKLIIAEFARDIDHQIDGTTLDVLSANQKSVCCISCKPGNTSRIGTGFYVGEGCVLSCWHVIKKVVDRDDLEQVTARILDCTAEFSYEHGTKDGIPIKRLVAYSPELDYALVQLRAVLPGIKALKFSTAPLPKSNVHLIGFPHNSAKRRCDPCCTVIDKDSFKRDNEEELGKIPEEHHLELFGGSSLAYHCSFFYGSSGCPVFNDEGRVVAIHKRGTIDCKSPSCNNLPVMAAGTNSLIEHGVKMEHIITDIRQRFSREAVVQEIFPTDI